MNRNRTTILLLCLLLLHAVAAHAQTISLDDAISNAADELSAALNSGSKVAVLSMRTDYPRMASYLVDEITSTMVNRRLHTVVDRTQLDLIQQEMDLQLSGEVSDESAQAIGKKLGAQVIITGSFEPLGEYHRFRLRLIEVETAAILATHSADVHNDPVVVSLIGTGTPVANYSDFTTGQRWGTAMLNLIPGLGSFVIMRDVKGGAINLSIMGIGGALMYLGASDMRYTIDGQKYSLKTPGLITGSAFLLGGTVFNIIRSASYHKPLP